MEYFLYLCSQIKIIQIMATVTLSYNPRSKYAVLTLDSLLASGQFKRAETRLERRIRKSMQEAQVMAADIQQNGSSKYPTLDDLLNELRAE